jgi:hypothetical protein
MVGNSNQWQSKPNSEGLLEQRRQEQNARQYRLPKVEHYSEEFIRRTFVNKPYKTRVSHTVAADLRRKDSRNFFVALYENLLRNLSQCFEFSTVLFSRCLSLLLPAREARVIGVFATVLAFALIAVSAAREVPVFYSAAAHSINSKAVIHEFKALI